MLLIFSPVEPRQIGPFKLHGLFMRRQDEIADVYSGIIAEDIVTLANMGDELLQGPRSDRTRQMLETAMRPAVDNAAGIARLPIRVAMGTRSTTRFATRSRSRRSITRSPHARPGVQPPPVRRRSGC